MSGMPFLSDEDREETIIERRERERAENGRVDNDEAIPLIPNVKLDARKTIHAIQVWKTDPPGDGFKGAVPPHTNYETIAKRFGNGLYDFHAVTQDEKVLRRNQGVKISFTFDEPEDDSPSHPVAPQADMRLLEWQAQEHTRSTQRTENFARMAVDSSRETAKQHLEMLSTHQKASADRDRDFFAGMMAQQQQFFAAIFQQSQTAHVQAMERSREDFRQTIQVLQMSHERAQKANDPTLLLSLFREGLALGSGNSDEEDESEPWVDAIKAGAGAIKDMTEIAKIKAIAVPKASPSLPEATQSTQAPSEHKQPKKQLPFDKNELSELIRLKRLMDQKGLDFASTLRNASAYFSGASDIDASTSNSGDSESGETGASGDAGAA